ncbi:MAG: tRNA epoxyqueuosine(34) reductase QueG [Bryobacterales bacterium]
MTSARVKQLAREVGFDLAGVAPAEPLAEAQFYPEWLRRGYHGAMGYLEGLRGERRADPHTLLKSAKSVICVAQVYHTPVPYSVEHDDPEKGWVARYAWGEDYHRTLKDRLYRLIAALQAEAGTFKFKVCVDTAPLLERAYAQRAGLGWIGKNTCLIDQRKGSWMLLGEALVSLDLEPDDPAPFRCGTCTRCIDACPTQALVPLEPGPGPSHALDATRCISYWTIELRGPVPEPNRAEIGRHVFGCDICQDVCPWNRWDRIETTNADEFQPQNAEPDLLEWASLSEEEYQSRFAETPLERSRYSGFLRNVCTAMGNAALPRFREPLERLAQHEDLEVREHAQWALARLDSRD